MIRLNRTELGQFNDKKFDEIKTDFESTMKDFLQRWEDIDTIDLQGVCLSQIGWLFSKYHMMSNINKLMKEKGYKSSSEAKTIKYIEQIVE